MRLPATDFHQNPWTGSMLGNLFRQSACDARIAIFVEELQCWYLQTCAAIPDLANRVETVGNIHAVS
jgi:hypothetical protein